ncbi:hypothetical protein Sste5346_008695 [Sporothrix stenoceras]|uniref:Uncharacterized protein n=1 Tax=Sporothrix stenoceras TaxID=5173 RepID=A0ABR3YP46_9PEZI
MANVETKILVLSDTHGLRFPVDRQPPNDGIEVVLHCGDLTEESKIAKFRTTLNMLKDIDLPAFHQKAAEAGLTSEPELVAREYG